MTPRAVKHASAPLEENTMSRQTHSHPVFLQAALVCALCFVPCAVRAATPADTMQQLESLTGLKASFNEAESVYKVTRPRTDVAVHVDRWTMPPFMGLTTWAAFAPAARGNVMLAGDFVLLEDEVNPVMSVLLAGGIEITALHNHFFFDRPRIMFMHVGGEGRMEAMAPVLRAALAEIDTIRARRPGTPEDFGDTPPPTTNAISGPAIAAILGHAGQSKDGMIKFVIGRAITMGCGCEVGSEMGINTWAAFAGTDGNAVVDGDFAVLESELQPVLRALRHGGIRIVAIHHHMTGESPRILFLHYWGRGKPGELAASVKKALDLTAWDKPAP